MMMDTTLVVLCGGPLSGKAIKVHGRLQHRYEEPRVRESLGGRLYDLHSYRLVREGGVPVYRYEGSATSALTRP